MYVLEWAALKNLGSLEPTKALTGRIRHPITTVNDGFLRDHILGVLSPNGAYVGIDGHDKEAGIYFPFADKKVFNYTITFNSVSGTLR